MDVSDRGCKHCRRRKQKSLLLFHISAAIFAVGALQRSESASLLGRALLANKRLRAVRRRRFCVPFCKGRDAKNARKPRGCCHGYFFRARLRGRHCPRSASIPLPKRASPARKRPAPRKGAFACALRAAALTALRGRAMMIQTEPRGEGKAMRNLPSAEDGGNGKQPRRGALAANGWNVALAMGAGAALLLALLHALGK